MSNSANKDSVLVTGADGFVGRHLVAELLARDIPVVATTRQPTNISGLKTIGVGDIDGNSDWGAALADCASVVHLAGRAHILRETQSDPAAAYDRVNTQGTRRLAQQAAEMGVRRFLFLSTIAVYEPGLANLSESTQTSPQTDYGRSKLAAEECVQAATSPEMSHTILRVPLVYGPGVGARFLQLLKLARFPVPLPLAGIDNQRSLLFVGNLVDLIIHALDHKQAENCTFLVSDGQDISTPDLVTLLAKGMGRVPNLWPLPKSVLDVGTSLLGREQQWQKLAGSLVVDSGNTEKALDWQPPFSADQGLVQTAVWFKGQHSH